MKKLTIGQIEVRMAEVGDWRIDQGKLYREFKFQDFPRAFGFMASMAIVCEALNHHPEWSNVFDSVKVWLVSHDVDGISDADFDLAKRMDLHFGG